MFKSEPPFVMTYFFVLKILRLFVKNNFVINPHFFLKNYSNCKNETLNQFNKKICGFIKNMVQNKR